MSFDNFSYSVKCGAGGPQEPERFRFPGGLLSLPIGQGPPSSGLQKVQSSRYGPVSKTALFCSRNRKGMLAASWEDEEQGGCQEGQTRKRYYFQWFKGLPMDEFCSSGWE